MKRVLSLILTLAMCISLLPVMTTETVVASDDTSETAEIELSVTYGQTEGRSMLEMINEFRTGDDAWYWNDDDTTTTTCSDLSELVYDYDLEAIAMQRAAEIAIYYSHTRPDNSTCWTAYEDYAWMAVGENIAAGYTSAEAVFEGWQEASESYSGQGHRRNMLSSDYTAVGIGHVYCDGYHYWVQEFAKSTNTSAETTANDSATDVSVTIALDNITSCKVTTDPDSYDLNVGTTASLPELTAKIRLSSTWPSSVYATVGVPSTWTSENTSCVYISDGQLVANASGSTNITTTALGEDVSVPVTVSAWDCEGGTSHNHGTPVFTWDDEYSAIATFTCVYGDDTQTFDVDVIPEIENETCTTDGLITYTATVTFNGETYTDTRTDTIEATGHDYDDGVVTKEETCEEDGIITYTCENCGDTYTETIEAIGHDYDDGVVTKEETCEEDGVITYTCGNCGDTYTETIETTGHNYETVTTPATCTEDGSVVYVCEDCGYTYTEIISATGHLYESIVTEEATTSKTGTIVKQCTKCGSIASTTTIAKIKSVTLSATSFTYNGKVKTPTVTVKDSNGKTISSKYYTVTYASGRKNVGTYKVKVTFKDRYSGIVTKTFKIKIKASSVSKLTAKSKGFTVKWSALAKSQATGYQIQYATNSSFTKNKVTKTITSYKTSSKTITKLKAKKKYYVRIRTYKTISGKKYYSSWSSAKTVTTKK